MYSTQLSDYKTYDTDNLILQATEKRTETRRIRILTHNMDGTRGDLVFSTPRFLSFGLQKIHDGQVLVGYQMPLVMWGKNGPTAEEKAFTNVLETITDVSRQFIDHHIDELERQGSDLEVPLYYKTNNTNASTQHAPLLYVRLNTFRNDDNLHIRSIFVDDNTRETIDPLTLLNRRCLVHSAIRIESIIMGTKVRFQLKLMEARVRFLDRGFKSLLEPGRVFLTENKEKKDD